MKKRYFPKKSKMPSTNNLYHRNSNWFAYSNGHKKCRNLRQEFDIIIRERHKLLSDDEVYHLWKQIGTQLLQAPNKSLEELINTLDLSEQAPIK